MRNPFLEGEYSPPLLVGLLVISVIISGLYHLNLFSFYGEKLALVFIFSFLASIVIIYYILILPFKIYDYLIDFLIKEIQLRIVRRK